MNLFIETPRQAAERRRRTAGASADSGDPGSQAPGWVGDDSRDRASGLATGASLRSRLFSRLPKTDPDPEPPASPERDAGAPSGDYSVAQQSYREELAFARRRAHHQKLGQLIRSLLLVIIIPLGLCAIFLASYALTCILNGATPQEVVALLGALLRRIEGFISSMS